jgi:tyrosinase
MDHTTFFTRRDFLKGAGAFASVTLALWSGGCESCARQIANRPKRRNIATMASNDSDLVTYKSAVTAMKGLPPSDHRNWENQAQIHFDHCPHGNWWFLPWHRAYLLYFEKICRQLTGSKDFALPYWNWTANPTIPDAFWGNGNPLFDSNRAQPQGATADSSFVGPSVIDNILGQTNFFTFASNAAVNQRDFGGYGMLEQTPHNYIHGWINGDMGQFHSPRDPIFWTHHNMLDCLWVDWNINRNNPNTNDTTWTNFQFTDFFDENGNPVTVNVLATVLYPIFLYQFEPCAPNEKGTSRTRQQLEEFLRAGAPVKLDFAQRFQLRQALTAEVGKPATGTVKIDETAIRGAFEGASKNHVVLTVGEVEFPEKNDFFVRIFVDKADATAQTPLEDQHYAGSFAFFFDTSAMKDMTGHGKPGYLVDVTPTLRKLRQGGTLASGEVNVTLVPVPYPGREAAGLKLTLGQLDVGVANY